MGPKVTRLKWSVPLFGLCIVDVILFINYANCDAVSSIEKWIKTASNGIEREIGKNHREDS